MERRQQPLILLVIGGTLFGLSFASFVRGDGRSVWTDEKAVQYQQAAAKFHHLAHEAGHLGSSGDSAHSPDDLLQAQAAFERLRTELDSARSATIPWPLLLRVVGGTIAVAGVIAYVAMRPKSTADLADFHEVRE